jgi:hypothetical protein
MPIVQGLIFTDHARLNMERRGIEEADVRRVWDNHDISYPGTNPKRDTVVRVGTARNDRRLCVVVDEGKPRLIVTAYWGDE